MLVFEGRGKPEYQEKNLKEQSRKPIKNSTLIIYDTRSGDQTRDTLVGDERSQHCTIPAPSKTESQDHNGLGSKRTNLIWKPQTNFGTIEIN